MGSLMISLQKNELKTRKERAVQQYIATEQKHGTEDSRTLLQYNLLKTIVLVEDLTQTINDMTGVLEAVKTFDSSIASFTQFSFDTMSKEDKKFWETVSKQSAFRRKISINQYKKRMKKEIMKQVSAVNMALWKVQIQSEVMNDLVEEMGRLLTPKPSKRGKKKKTDKALTQFDRLTEEAIAAGRSSFTPSTQSNPFES